MAGKAPWTQGAWAEAGRNSTSLWPCEQGWSEDTVGKTAQVWGSTLGLRTETAVALLKGCGGTGGRTDDEAGPRESVKGPAGCALKS